MRRFVNKLLYTELVQSCIVHDGMYYLPLDQLVTLILNLMFCMAVFLTVGWVIAESIISIVRLRTYINEKKYGGKYETL